MDKQTFINLAPEYYMVALFLHLDYPMNYYSEDSFLEAFTVTDDQENRTCLVGNDELRAEALRLMVKNDAIEVIADPFGSAVWKRGANMTKWKKCFGSQRSVRSTWRRRPGIAENGFSRLSPT